MITDLATYLTESFTANQSALTVNNFGKYVGFAQVHPHPSFKLDVPPEVFNPLAMTDARYFCAQSSSVKFFLSGRIGGCNSH